MGEGASWNLRAGAGGAEAGSGKVRTTVRASLPWAWRAGLLDLRLQRRKQLQEEVIWATGMTSEPESGLGRPHPSQATGSGWG